MPMHRNDNPKTSLQLTPLGLELSLRLLVIFGGINAVLFLSQCVY